MAILDLRQHPRDSIEWNETGLRAARLMKDRDAEGTHLGNLGRAYANLGELARPSSSMSRLWQYQTKLGKKGEGAWLLCNMGLAYASLGETHKAIEYYEQALAIYREFGGREGEEASLGSLGNAYADLGENLMAIDHHDRALSIARESETKEMNARIYAIWLGLR